MKTQDKEIRNIILAEPLDGWEIGGEHGEGCSSMHPRLVPKKGIEIGGGWRVVYVGGIPLTKHRSNYWVDLEKRRFFFGTEGEHRFFGAEDSKKLGRYFDNVIEAKGITREEREVMNEIAVWEMNDRVVARLGGALRGILPITRN